MALNLQKPRSKVKVTVTSNSNNSSTVSHKCPATTANVRLR